MRTPEDWAMNEWQGKIHTAQDAIILVSKIQCDAQGIEFDPMMVKVNVPKKKVSTKNAYGEDNKKEPCFHDDDIMPFGKYKDLPLKDVDADYLGWLFQDGCKNIKLRNYIWNSRNALNKEMEQEDKHIHNYVQP